MNLSPKTVFVIGPPRSGTTLLGLIALEHHAPDHFDRT